VAFTPPVDWTGIATIVLGVTFEVSDAD